MASACSSPNLARIARGDLCSGCGACVALAPDSLAMRMVAPGYLRPQQTAPLDLRQETAIGAVCPGLGQRVEAAGRQDTVLWGPYLDVRTGWAADPVLRHAASSGGAISAILVHLLASGTVDAVIATGADPDQPVGNVPLLARDAAAVAAAAGSRYAPSAPLAELPALLAEHRATGRRFALVGKPCDAAALRAMQARDPELTVAIPVVLSFFCGGVPSAGGANAVLAAMGADPQDTVAFRYRGNGWPGRATATLKDGSECFMSYHESWGRILTKHVQHRCKICADGTGAAADIVCADAWESDERGYPRFSEGEGVSLIMARTPLGVRLLEAAEAGAAIETVPFALAGLAAIQPGQCKRKRALLARLAAQRLTGRPIPRYRGLQLFAAARQNSVLRNLGNFLGTLRRLLRQRK